MTENIVTFLAGVIVGASIVNPLARWLRAKIAQWERLERQRHDTE